MVDEKAMGRTIKVKPEGVLCDNELILHLDCGSGYTNLQR